MSNLVGNHEDWFSRVAAHSFGINQLFRGTSGEWKGRFTVLSLVPFLLNIGKQYSPRCAVAECGIQSIWSFSACSNREISWKNEIENLHL